MLGESARVWRYYNNHLLTRGPSRLRRGLVGGGAKKAIIAVFEPIEVDGAAEITKAVPRERVRPLLITSQSLLILYVKCPQGNSNPCRSLERAVS
jgi:hypothetical protein